MIWSPQPVPVGAPAELRFIRSSEDEDLAYQFHLPASEAKPMEGFTFKMFGRLVDDPAIDFWQFNPAGELDHELRVEVWWLEVPISRALRAVRLFEVLTGQSRRSVEVMGEGWDDDWERRGATRVKRGIKALDMLMTKPGPTAGEVAGTKYKTPDEWRAAIREKVLTRPSRATAPEESLAQWLGVGMSTMYRLMGRWGPRTLEDLRNGKL